MLPILPPPCRHPSLSPPVVKHFLELVALKVTPSFQWRSLGIIAASTPSFTPTEIGARAQIALNFLRLLSVVRPYATWTSRHVTCISSFLVRVFFYHADYTREAERTGTFSFCCAGKTGALFLVLRLVCARKSDDVEGGEHHSSVSPANHVFHIPPRQYYCHRHRGRSHYCFRSAGTRALQSIRLLQMKK
jgi:hypothetical protein